MPDSSEPVLYDVLIVGGGPGGLATATALSRQLRTAALFDSGVYRNARASHMHNYLGFDHVPPAELRAKGRKDLQARYNTTTFIDRQIVSIAKLPVKASDGSDVHVFKAIDSASQTHFGRSVVIAAGVADIMPSGIEGFADCWGRGIFHCLFCHGFEERGAHSAGVLTGGMVSVGKMAMHMGHMAKQLAQTVTLYTNGDEVMAQELVAAGGAFKVDKRQIIKVEMSAGAKATGGGQEESDKHFSDITLYFADGQSVREGFLAHAPKTKANGPFAEQLGLELSESGDYKTVNFFGESTTPGVYAVGDCGQMVKAVATATASGAIAAAGMTMYLAANPKDIVLPQDS
ncbi:hypothetical protein DFS34DRAFT_619888 [Phlyctochytrium arcticum]|nr:hypothetical protein DFS34DRAFT_619888 [Phlyctochytrium arcticum]